MELEADLNASCLSWFRKFIGLTPLELQLLGFAGESMWIGESRFAVLNDPDELLRGDTSRFFFTVSGGESGCVRFRGFGVNLLFDMEPPAENSSSESNVDPWEDSRLGFLNIFPEMLLSSLGLPVSYSTLGGVCTLLSNVILSDGVLTVFCIFTWSVPFKASSAHSSNRHLVIYKRLQPFWLWWDEERTIPLLHGGDEVTLAPQMPTFSWVTRTLIHLNIRSRL